MNKGGKKEIEVEKKGKLNPSAHKDTWHTSSRFKEEKEINKPKKKEERKACHIQLVIETFHVVSTFLNCLPWKERCVGSIHE